MDWLQTKFINYPPSSAPQHFPLKQFQKYHFQKSLFPWKHKVIEYFPVFNCFKLSPSKSITPVQILLPNYYQTVTISTFLMFPQSFPGNFPNSSLHPKIMSAFLSCCLQLLSILKIHAIGRGPPATISNLISSTYYRNRKSDPENQNYPTWFPNRIHFTHDQKKPEIP